MTPRLRKRQLSCSLGIATQIYRELPKQKRTGFSVQRRRGPGSASCESRLCRRGRPRPSARGVSWSCVYPPSGHVCPPTWFALAGSGPASCPSGEICTNLAEQLKTHRRCVCCYARAVCLHERAAGIERETRARERRCPWCGGHAHRLPFDNMMTV